VHACELMVDRFVCKHGHKSKKIFMKQCAAGCNFFAATAKTPAWNMRLILYEKGGWSFRRANASKLKSCYKVCGVQFKMSRLKIIFVRRIKLKHRNHE
jgi:hypothetical protein